MYHLFIDEIQQISLRCPPALMRIRYRTMEQLQEALFIEIRIDDLDECAAYVALTPLDVCTEPRPTHEQEPALSEPRFEFVKVMTDRPICHLQFTREREKLDGLRSPQELSGQYDLPLMRRKGGCFRVHDILSQFLNLSRIPCNPDACSCFPQ